MNNDQTNQLATFAVKPMSSSSSLSTASVIRFDATLLPTLDEITSPKKVVQPSNSLLRTSSSSFSSNVDTKTTCPDDEGFVYLSNKIVATASTSSSSSSSSLSSRRKIPKIIHQTGKSRCVTQTIYDLAIQYWYNFETSGTGHGGGSGSGEWSYYFHDDDAIYRLLVGDDDDDNDDTNEQDSSSSSSPFKYLRSLLHETFPTLRQVALGNCGILGENGALKTDLWRYIILWLYGGIYADLDTKPNYEYFNTTTIHPTNDDAFFVVEQYHILSQYFMALSPQHPIMYYSIQHALLNLLQLQDTLQVGAQYQTGPHVLHTAYREFRYDYDGKYKVDPILPGLKPVQAGVYTGTYNHTITVVGVGENQNQYITRQAIPERKKQQAYAKMGLKHFSSFTSYKGGKTSDITCITSIYNYTATTAIHQR